MPQNEIKNDKLKKVKHFLFISKINFCFTIIKIEKKEKILIQGIADKNHK